MSYTEWEIPCVMDTVNVYIIGEVRNSCGGVCVCPLIGY